MDKSKLLSDENLRTFLTQGFLVLKPDLPREFHLELHKQCNAAVEMNHGNPGNNLLPCVPQIQQVFDCPAIFGALQSVLGSRWIMHPHRHIHANTHSAGGGWHKDSYWGYTRKIRNHRPWWVMIMYYPQDVAPENGPTGVLAGRQCHLTRGKDDDQGADAVCGEAGTCFLIHYDLWHRATPNTSGVNRQMLKFEFIRMDAPEQPAWDCRDPEWREPSALPPFPHRGLWRQSWNFLNGRRRPADHQTVAELDGRSIDALSDVNPRARADAADQLERCGPGAAQALPQLIPMLSDEYEPARINAAYALAAIGASAVPELIETLTRDQEPSSVNAGYALAAMGSEAIPALLDALRSSAPNVRSSAAFALGEIREGNGDTIGALARVVRDEDARVRLHAVEALGMKGAPAKNATPSLIAALRDADNEVRFDAALALARLGPAAAEATPALAAALGDPDRYVRGYAVEALHQIGTKAAFKALVPHLKTARWCTNTGPGSLF